MARPFVSCLMVTQVGRERLAARAIADFYDQVYPIGRRELVIVTDGGPAHELALAAMADKWVAGYQGGPSPRVRVLGCPAGATLGAARNVACRAAEGDLLCQWDDDDRYPPSRLPGQVDALVADPAAACLCLTSQLYLFLPAGALYWIDWRRRGPRRSHLIPGTIVIRKDVAAKIAYPEEGKDARRGEDGAYLRDALRHGTAASLPLGLGGPYVRQFHGNNTWGESRFKNNVRWLGLSAAEISPLLVRLARQAIDVLRPDTPGAVRLLSRDGAVVAHL